MYRYPLIKENAPTAPTRQWTWPCGELGHCHYYTKLALVVLRWRKKGNKEVPVCLLYSYEKMKREHQNMNKKTQNEHELWRSHNGLMVYWERHISKLCFCNKPTLKYDLHGKKWRFLNVLVHIFEFAFHLSMTAHVHTGWRNNTRISDSLVDFTHFAASAPVSVLHPI